MASLRFSRDKRGYEHFYIVQSFPTRRGKPPRTRILYWFRTPPNARVGREPFDEELRRALERQNPDVTFDWKKLIETPIPPPGEPEPWRERRRAEKAAKQAARAEAEAAAATEAQATEQPPADLESAPELSEDAADEAAAAEPAVVAHEAQPALQTSGSEPESPARRRRRHRRGRRGPRPPGMTEPGTPVESQVLTEPRAPAELPETGEEPKV